MQMTAIASAIAQTALQALQSGLSKDKGDKHAFIVAQTAIVLAVALCNAPPKGYGNPADWKALAGMFASVGLKAYGEHSAAFPQAFKTHKPRSVADWDSAMALGAEIAIAAFTGCAPRTYTADELAARATKRANAKAAREKDAKQAEKDVKAAHRAEVTNAADKAAQAALSADNVAAMIRAGQYSADALAIIRDALAAIAAPVAVGETVAAG